MLVRLGAHSNIVAMPIFRVLRVRIEDLAANQILHFLSHRRHTDPSMCCFIAIGNDLNLRHTSLVVDIHVLDQSGTRSSCAIIVLRDIF